MTIKLYTEAGGQGDIIAELDETGQPPDAPCWTSSVTNDDESKSFFLSTVFEGVGGFREFHGAGTFDLPSPQPITFVTVRNKAFLDAQPS